MRRTSLLVAAVMAFGVATVPASTARATGHTADAVYELPMTRFKDIAVDAEHGRVFVTAGPLSDGVVVRSISGAAAPGVTGQEGASGLAVSPDGTRLYVALYGADAVSAIDTTTLTEVARYPTGAGTCPTWLDATADQVWFGYGCLDGAEIPANIGVVDLSGEEPAVTLGRAPQQAWGLTYLAPHVELTPDGTRMVASGFGINPTPYYSLTVSGTTLTLAAGRSAASLRDFTLSPDGTRVLTADHATYTYERWLVSDLSADGSLGTTVPPPNAVAAAGSVVAGGSSASFDRQIRVFRPDGSVVRSYQTDMPLQNGGLAFTSDADHLYAVTGHPEYPLYLHVFHDPAKVPTTVTLTRPASAKVNMPYTVTGSIAPAVAGATVHVVRQSRYGSVALPDATTSASGAFSFTDTVPKRGTYTYTATFDGNDAVAGSTRSLAFGVAGLVPSITVATNASTYPFHATATMTARLGTTAGNRVLRLSVTPYGYGSTVLRTGAVDSGGYLRASYTVTRRTTFTAYFAGDDVYEPRSVSLARGVAAGLSQKLAGYYSTSGSYRLYRRSADPVLNLSVAPNRAGTCTTWEAQRYVSGSWRAVTTNTCIRLSSTSRASAVLVGDPMVGVPYRVRGTFNGDASNLRTPGAWLYLRFTR